MAMGMLTVTMPVAGSAQVGCSAVEQSEAEAYDALWVLLRLDDLVDIMREEGTAMALDADMGFLGRPGGAPWRDRVATIYDEARIQSDTEKAMESALAAEHLPVLCRFYQSDEMQTIVDLEISARRAFMDQGIEDLARSEWLSGRALTPHEDAIFHFVEVNDLVERNVVGAMNSNYAFLQALTDAHPVVSERMTEDEILTEVWSQEVEIRRDTSEWLLAFLSTAYAPVSVDDLNEYVAFSETEAGHALNHALFDAFDIIYVRLSAELGRAVSEIGAQEEL